MKRLIGLIVLSTLKMQWILYDKEFENRNFRYYIFIKTHL